MKEKEIDGGKPEEREERKGSDDGSPRASEESEKRKRGGADGGPEESKSKRPAVVPVDREKVGVGSASTLRCLTAHPSRQRPMILAHPLRSMPHSTTSQVCPMLLRIFPRFQGHHRAEAFQHLGKMPTDELPIYTWMDATLKELGALVCEANEQARHTGARLAFATLFRDR